MMGLSMSTLKVLRKPDPLKNKAQDMRTTFERMGMNDEETVALQAGGQYRGESAW